MARRINLNIDAGIPIVKAVVNHEDDAPKLSDFESFVGLALITTYHPNQTPDWLYRQLHEYRDLFNGHHQLEAEYGGTYYTIHIFIADHLSGRVAGHVREQVNRGEID